MFQLPPRFNAKVELPVAFAFLFLMAPAGWMAGGIHAGVHS